MRSTGFEEIALPTPKSTGFTGIYPVKYLRALKERKFLPIREPSA